MNTTLKRGSAAIVGVAESDLGKVIGKGGRIANAMRTIVKAAATKHDRKATVEILS